MKKFLVPCFIVVDGAETKEQADLLAQRHQSMKNGSVLLFDEELPTIEINDRKEYPHSIIGEYGLTRN